MPTMSMYDARIAIQTEYLRLISDPDADYAFEYLTYTEVMADLYAIRITGDPYSGFTCTPTPESVVEAYLPMYFEGSTRHP